MKKIFFIILILTGYKGLIWGQQEINKLTTGMVFGYLEDTLFEGVNERTLILLNEGTNELKITLFKDGLLFENKELQDYFDQLEGDMSIQFIIDPRSFEHKENVLENDIYQTVALAKINGISVEVLCSYSLHIIKTNNQIYGNMKITINTVIDRSDFELTTDMNLSPEIELEITDGPINVH